ncbi:FYVE-domain-containing protein [Aspergillus heteromorphus CBS 117.55]|uniref:RING-type E3 ubiquitin transferase n=1 Tax=Aspergillus heteromorphus CBS 117.55 TaxID=1448321 RepID=A0A317VVR3_9EURO|nr:FYVE-domain-containing protein [Aspergillus heteromorphus CBS 117.55]PWY77062.1 FYVE-domain-containing protein [Aspergillus heteromorphus CBS 117.55]
MSSLSSSASASSASAASPSASSATAAAAFSVPPPPPAGFRPHASSEHLRTSEAGPALDRRSERRRSTLSGSDRKRRIINLEGDAWSRRAAPDPLTEPGPSSTSGGRRRRGEEMDSRSMPRFSFQPRPESTSVTPGSSYASAIDLSSSPPDSRRQGTNDHRHASRAPTAGDYVEYVRPQWQPDAEVAKCPICGAAFSFFYRKHHCRKCGRVVCSSCSPHRITIPRQFIVHDPSRSHASSIIIPPAAPVIDLEGDGLVQSPTALNPALGGGEEVRLCNPCVPDPNPEPPRGFATVRAPGEPESGPDAGQGAYPFPTNQPRHRSYHSLSSYSLSSARQNPYSGPDNFTSQPGRRTVGSSNEYTSFGGFGGAFNPQFQERPVEYGSFSMSGSRFPPTGSSTRPPPYPAGGSASSLPVGSSSMRTPAHRAAQWRGPQVAEQDLCPICDQELPALGANGSEDAREAHIRGCIESHGRQGRVSVSPQSGSPVAQPPLPVRLVVFTATEKDCIGQDGGLQECTICMEEYEVGQALVRLECLCKFHKRCIVEWFERKKECPVHKVS